MVGDEAELDREGAADGEEEVEEEVVDPVDYRDAEQLETPSTATMPPSQAATRARRRGSACRRTCSAEAVSVATAAP
jgi:hypothetical protein